MSCAMYFVRHVNLKKACKILLQQTTGLITTNKDTGILCLPVKHGPYTNV